MCQEKDNLENIRVLYQEAQNRRTHLSQVIVTNIGYAITLTTAIWGFFGKGYIDAVASQYEKQRDLAPWYLFVAALLTSIVVILWRLYTHYLDNKIVKEYPWIFFYESKLDVPGCDLIKWKNFIEKYAGKDSDIWAKAKSLDAEQRRRFVSILAKRRRYGCRGHNGINLAALVYLIGVWILAIWLGMEIHQEAFMALVVSVFSLVAVVCAYGQQNPSEEDIRSAIDKALENPG